MTSVPRTASTWPEVPLLSGFKQWQQIPGRRILRGALETVEDRARAARPSSVNTELLKGNTVPTLVGLSKEAEMIVAGCRGRGALRRRLLGSVSSGLVHYAHCPVAVIHDWGQLPPAGEASVGAPPGAGTRRCGDRRFTGIGIGDGDRLRRSFAPKGGTRCRPGLPTQRLSADPELVPELKACMELRTTDSRCRREVKSALTPSYPFHSRSTFPMWRELSHALLTATRRATPHSIRGRSP